MAPLSKNFSSSATIPQAQSRELYLKDNNIAKILKETLLDIQLQKKPDLDDSNENMRDSCFYDSCQDEAKIICNKLQITPTFQRIRSPLLKSIGFALIAAVNAGLLIFLAMHFTPLFSLIGLFAGVMILSILLAQLVVGAYQATTYARLAYQNAQISQAVTICKSFSNEQEQKNIVKFLSLKIIEDHRNHEWDQDDLESKLHQQLEQINLQQAFAKAIKHGHISPAGSDFFVRDFKHLKAFKEAQQTKDELMQEVEGLKQEKKKYQLNMLKLLWHQH